MTDHQTKPRRTWLRDQQRPRIPEWVGGIIAGALFALLFNLFP